MSSGCEVKGESDSDPQLVITLCNQKESLFFLLLKEEIKESEISEMLF